MLKPPHTSYARVYTYHLEGTGIPSVTDPDFIGMWVEDDRTVLIFHQPKEELVSDLCHRFDCRLFYQADLDYADWEMGREVEPFRVGLLTVAPIWSQEKADIKIDPSVVFGNGFHPSTRLCLEAMVKYYSGLPQNFTALDLGCGTGLLAIGAARLGASSVQAVDYNSLACDVTKQNTAYNQVESIVSVVQLDLRRQMVATDVDLILANLHHELLGKLLQEPSFWQARLYILSGFMPGEEEHLLAALPNPSPPFLERRRQDKWCVWIMGRLNA
jgi:ribosomal protein L11 methyltransferase